MSLLRGQTAALSQDHAWAILFQCASQILLAGTGAVGHRAAPSNPQFAAFLSLSDRRSPRSTKLAPGTGNGAKQQAAPLAGAAPGSRSGSIVESHQDRFASHACLRLARRSGARDPCQEWKRAGTGRGRPVRIRDGDPAAASFRRLESSRRRTPCRKLAGRRLGVSPAADPRQRGPASDRRRTRSPRRRMQRGALPSGSQAPAA